MINTNVTQLFRSHDQYRDMSLVDEVNHLHMPFHYGRMEMYKGKMGHIVFTWTRPTNGWSLSKLIKGEADEELWQDHTEDMSYTPWIVDVAGSPAVTGHEIGTFLREVCVVEEIAHEGQKVLFHRSGGIRTGRIGYFTARGAR